MPFQSTLPTRGSDRNQQRTYYVGVIISIHAAHEGQRHKKVCFVYLSAGFQSTLPTRGSDYSQTILLLVPFLYFNPRCPRGAATSIFSLRSGRLRQISIHAAHEGQRRRRQFLQLYVVLFQSTLPTRGSDWQCVYIMPHLL